jgi:competence protein ComEA
MLKRIMVLAVAGLLSINVSANDAVKAQVDSAKEGVKKEAAAKVEAVTAPKAATAAAATAATPAPAAPVEKIDINKADAKTLEKTLDGIGAKKAEAIVKYRTDKGPFTKVEDLLKVDGVGEAALKKNMDKLMVVAPAAKAAAPATTPAAKPAATPAAPAKPAEAAHK